ncbi:hypothetical protein [Streptococcus equi]|uniref:Anti-phagocytic factor H binding protein n=1 Tax=Streptococcus equi subsp. zooepidemicus TaxID=40041 RepID=A0A7Z8ZY79_STRSZ|nr:hypothetical protein [Streptococcus equi]VEF09076.1 anti-phagocytic factor H binding protein [Streptococcus equi subsp. zooepidemicus]
MKKLVLASAAALVLAGAVAGTGTVRAQQPWRVPSWYLRSSSSRRYRPSQYAYLAQSSNHLTPDQKHLADRKKQAKEDIDTLTLADQQKYDFKKKIDSVRDYTVLSSILREAKMYSNTNERFLQKYKELYEKSVNDSNLRNRIDEIKKNVEYDAGYSAQQGINELKRLDNSLN